MSQVRRIVVTGAYGFVGSAISDALGGLPDTDIRPLDRFANGTAGEIVVQLTDQSAVTDMLRDTAPDVVVHVAGRTFGTIEELYRDNAAASAVLAEAVLKACPKAILVAIGSAAEYGPLGDTPIAEDAPGRPVGPYGHAKLAAAHYLMAARERGLRVTLARIFNIIGRVNSPFQVVGGFIDKAARAFVAGEEAIVPLGRLDAVRDYVTLDDIGRAVAALVDRRVEGEIVNICTGRGVPVRQVIQTIVRQSGAPIGFVEQGAPVARNDISIGDPARLKALTGFQALDSLDQTLEDAWKLALDKARAAAG